MPDQTVLHWYCTHCQTRGSGPFHPTLCIACGATGNWMVPCASAMRACRVCGCTDDQACVDDRTKQPCHWVAQDLCSACVGLEQLLQQQTIAKGLALGEALEQWKEMNGAPVGEDLEPFAVFMFSRGFDACQALAEALAMVAERDIFAPVDPTPASEILLPGRDFQL